MLPHTSWPSAENILKTSYTGDASIFRHDHDLQHIKDSGIGNNYQWSNWTKAQSAGPADAPAAGWKVRPHSQQHTFYNM